MVALQRCCSKTLRRTVAYKHQHYDSGKTVDSESELTDTSYDPASVVNDYKQQQRSLTEQEVKEVVMRYGFGASTYELAAVYGVHRSTISRALKKSGIEVSNEIAKRRELTEQILKMYDDRLRPEDIGKQLGINKASVLKLLHENGVRIRHSSEYKEK